MLKNKRYESYLQLLAENLLSVETVLNNKDKILQKKALFSKEVIVQDFYKNLTYLELSLASLGVILRKMDENHFINLPQDIRTDCNSLIHSNRFELDQNNNIIVYSKRGPEDIDIYKIIAFTKSLL